MDSMEIVLLLYNSLVLFKYGVKERGRIKITELRTFGPELHFFETIRRESTNMSVMLFYGR